MRFTDEQIRRIAAAVLADLSGEGRATLKAERGRIQARIEDIVHANLAEEEALERDARKLLESHLQGAPPGVDRQKLFLMIKKKLAEDRGVPL